MTLALGSLLASCSSNESAKAPQIEPSTTDPLPSPATVATFMTSNDRCDTVRDLMVDTVVHQTLAPYYGHHYGRPDVAPRPIAPPPMAEPMPVDRAKATATADAKSAAAGQAVSGPSHYTTTNVQERGVDEGDLVKTDGTYVYTIRNNELVIAKAWPVDKTSVAARIAFKNLHAQQLYLNGDEIVVTGVATDTQSAHGTTRVAVIDIADRQTPKLDRTFDVEGSTASSRVVGGDLYLVQNAALAPPQVLYAMAQEELAKIPRADQQTLRPWEIQSRIAKSLRAKLLANLSTDDVATVLPKIKSNGATRAMACKDLYIPQNTTQLGLTTLARISIESQGTDLVGAMVTGGMVYASTDSIYVSQPAYTWNDQGYANQQTQIHKFSLTANDGRPTYVATGSVDGTVLNQFSMSEHDGHLRVATTDWNWNGSEGGNHLFVLRADGRHLTTIGSIRGLAKGERIYSGRMFGDKGYLVTFRQTDPLFTLDLSDPTKPRVVGELKINGFSNYIHPMGNDLLLAIGQDATDQGRVTGFHMQVFDVSNPAKPTRRFHEKLASWSSYSASIAERDHHAFTYDPVTGTLALPVSGHSDEGQPFNGLVVYNIDKQRGFTLHGRVTHRGLAAENLDKLCAGTASNDPWNNTRPYYCDAGSRPYQIAQLAQIDRSIVVDKYILSLGTSGMEIHRLDKLSKRAARLHWPQPNADRATLIVRAD